MSDSSYQIGALRLDPDRQLLAGGSPVAIGRKQLALLTVLARARGSLVTKDELMSAVWPNLFIEENALQAQIGALRKVLGAEAERLITVRGMGYRLTVGAGSQPEAGFPTPSSRVEHPASVRMPRRTVFLLAAALLVGTAMLPLMRDLFAAQGNSAIATSTIEMHPVVPRGSGQARAFAAALSSSIEHAVSETQAVTVTRHDGSGTSAADTGLLIGGEVTASGDDLNVSVRLEDLRAHAVVWATESRGFASNPHALQTSVAARVADTVRWAKDARSGRVRLDAPTLATFIAARELSVGTRDGGDGAASAAYRKVIAAAPDFSDGHSGAAASKAFLAQDEPSLADARALRDDARREALRAFALDRHNGEAYMALATTLPPHDWAKREALMRRGVTEDPDFEPLILFEGRLLWAVGRNREAIAWFERVHGENPLFIHATGSLVLALAADGQIARSDAVLAQMQADWPASNLTKVIALWAALMSNRDQLARAILADPGRRRDDMSSATLNAWRAALISLPAKPSVIARATAVTSAAARAGWLPRGTAFQLLARLSATHAAFAEADANERLDGIPPFFLPTAAALRADPYFMQVARRFGLVEYWTKTDHWPDFCGEPTLTYDCRLEAAKIMAIRKTAQISMEVPIYRRNALQK